MKKTLIRKLLFIAGMTAQSMAANNSVVQGMLQSNTNSNLYPHNASSSYNLVQTSNGIEGCVMVNDTTAERVYNATVHYFSTKGLLGYTGLMENYDFCINQINQAFSIQRQYPNDYTYQQLVFYVNGAPNLSIDEVLDRIKGKLSNSEGMKGKVELSSLEYSVTKQFISYWGNIRAKGKIYLFVPVKLTAYGLVMRQAEVNGTARYFCNETDSSKANSMTDNPLDPRFTWNFQRSIQTGSQAPSGLPIFLNGTCNQGVSEESMSGNYAEIETDANGNTFGKRVQYNKKTKSGTVAAKISVDGENGGTSNSVIQCSKQVNQQSMFVQDFKSSNNGQNVSASWRYGFQTNTRQEYEIRQMNDNDPMLQGYSALPDSSQNRSVNVSTFFVRGQLISPASNPPMVNPQEVTSHDFSVTFPLKNSNLKQDMINLIKTSLDLSQRFGSGDALIEKLQAMKLDEHILRAQKLTNQLRREFLVNWTGGYFVFFKEYHDANDMYVMNVKSDLSNHLQGTADCEWLNDQPIRNHIYLSTDEQKGNTCFFVVLPTMAGL